MPRPVTLFTGQWADLTFDVVCAKAKSFGYDGIEIACWGDHFEVDKALNDERYIQTRLDVLAQHGLQCHAISNHLVGQAVCDNIDARHKSILPARIWGDGKEAGVRTRAAAEMMNTARGCQAWRQSCCGIHGLVHLAVPLLVSAKPAGAGAKRLPPLCEHVESDSGCVR